MDAGPLSIRKIFSQDRRHLVPLFQRPYVWEREKQWEPLWDDVRRVAERLLENGDSRPHFLGAIVLDQVQRPTGQIETRLLIDGQQRLTTLQIMLEAFCDLCAVEGMDKHNKALLKLTRNDDPMSEEPDEEFKVWPTNIDQEAFRRVMRFDSPEDVREAYGVKADCSTGRPIADVYLFFYQQIQEWLADEEDTADRYDALLNSVRDYLRLVVIDLDKDEDDAQLIFETLNARGTPLLPSDLIKNYLFHQARLRGADLDPLYEGYWRPFDDDEKYWRKWIGRGHAKRARIDLFFQYYLTAQLKDEVPVGHLYVLFKEFAEADGSPEAVLGSVRQYAGVYRSFERFEAGSREQVFFGRLGLLDVTTTYPFLLELFAGETEREEILAILDDLESFLVRRMVCHLSTRGYNRLFIDLVKELDGEEGRPSQRVRQFLLKSDADASRWPKDDEFKAAWMALPQYPGLAQKRVRLILEALEQDLRSDKTEEVSLEGSLTIEHLLPRRWHAHWPLPEGRRTETVINRREQLLRTLGNLTLLTKALNPSVSNGPWEQKRREIGKHSILRLNNELVAYDTWDEEQIEARGRELLDVAWKLWPRAS